MDPQTPDRHPDHVGLARDIDRVCRLEYDGRDALRVQARRTRQTGEAGADDHDRPVSGGQHAGSVIVEVGSWQLRR